MTDARWISSSGLPARVGHPVAHPPPRAQPSEPTSKAEVRAFTALSADPKRGQEISGTDPKLWRYDDEMEDVHVIYYATALQRSMTAPTSPEADLSYGIARVRYA
ncbi:hypothetical protein ACH4D5_21075 [Streptomyces sp. NPDC018029]|uniref:hypothetical protein n=1 Tax=Streptomyces sp. NPDC018029 TaxID=3365032 RepID=UPI0037B798C5